MSKLRDIVRQVKPVLETCRVDHAEKIHYILKEGSLTPSEVVKRDSRINLFIQKFKANDPFE